MSLMKKRLDEINTIVDSFIMKVEQDTGERRVCYDSLSPQLRKMIEDHGYLNQPPNAMELK